MLSSNSKRIFYFDEVRTIAILFVVLLHVSCHLAEIVNYNSVTIHSITGFYETFAINFYTIGVGLFLLLSGALLLGRDWDIKGFLIKKIPRILIPFLFWSAIFTIILILSSYFIPNISYISDFGIYSMLKLFWDTLMCVAPGSAVYWFFWMMLGVYLTMPVINRWIKDADFSEIEYFLVLWIVTTICEYTLLVDLPIDLSYFTSPVGFVVLGYYLRYTDRKIFNSSLIALLMIILSNIVMFLYSYHVMNTDLLFSFNRYSIFEIIEAIGVFCLFKSLDSTTHNPKVKKIISSISICSYGMYLTHSQIIMVTRKILPTGLNFTVEYIILFAAGFIGSWLLMAILSKIPFVNNFIGIK